MADSFTTTESTGFLGNMGKSIMAVPIGILLFLASFVVFWKTEGRLDWSKIAASSAEAPADQASGKDGTFISVTGTLSTEQKLGDPDFVSPGTFVTLERDTQMYAWVEHKKSETKKKTGGGNTTTTTYTYTREWTSSPKPSSDFQHPADHQNPSPSVTDARFAVTSAKVGAWGFKLADAKVPSGDDLPLDQAILQGKGLTATKVGDELFLGAGTPDVPQLGDMKVSFDALSTGGTMTAFGSAAGSQLTPHLATDTDTFLRVLKGNRAQALATLKSEFKAMGWIGRIVGFVMMWVGMTMVFTPLHAFLDVLPFLGSVSRNLLGCVLFPIALVLSGVTIVISMVLHSWVAMLVIVALLGGVGFFAWKKKQAQG